VSSMLASVPSTKLESETSPEGNPDSDQKQRALGSPASVNR
jgi:hypothetical protein